MIDTEHLAKCSDAKVAAPGNKFEHYPTYQAELGSVAFGKTRTVSG
jgi:hypothetical protein